MIKRIQQFLLLVITIVISVSCSSKKNKQNIFNKISPEKSGINFKNTLTESDSLNYFMYPYLYMGGGVAVGDVNNDGLQDLFFTGNMVTNKLYLNKGNLKFEDISDVAGVSGSKNEWYTGVTMSDVNNDGYVDIYVSVSGKYGDKKNKLYINQQNNSFLEEAEKWGIADSGNSVQSTFFDYDNDGDLDLYVANYPPTAFNAPNSFYRLKMTNFRDIESDKLFRNDGDVFTDVSKQAGVANYSLSLSATISDINNDGWKDIYVSNDFASPDFMYINNGDGTFTDQLKQSTNQTSQYGMGVDIADFNNDGLQDILEVDMSPESNRRSKANMMSMNPRLFWGMVRSGFHYQYMQNSLQLNRGVDKDSLPVFSGVSRLAGLATTDWSWGPLFADFDNDGWKDIFISNGTRKEINNRDYFLSLNKSKNKRDSLLYKSNQIPSEKIDNYIFKNQKDLTFSKVNEEWGIEYEGFSNGAAYVDLDNDGDLDLVINNIDDYASVFENLSAEKTNYINISFQNFEKNHFANGAKVEIVSDSLKQFQELTNTRGFQSSVDNRLHFGLGDRKMVDTLRVTWPNGKQSIQTNIEANQFLNLNYKEEKFLTNKLASKQNYLFKQDTIGVLPKHKHVENPFDDFSKQVLLPHRMSTFGPGLTVSDINNDGLDDFFIGGASGVEGAIYLQEKNGFKRSEVEFLTATKMSEDVGALFLDVDNDGDQDLYVVSGGYEFDSNSENLQDRLYVNDGKAEFKLLKNALPTMLTSGSNVYEIDFNKDNKKDLLVLGRQVPGKYPSAAKTYLLENISENDSIKFKDVTESYCKEFTDLGMATSAVVSDYNMDGFDDIIVVGEWMPISVFKNDGNAFLNVTKDLNLEKTKGWWWSISQNDFDGDGDMDYLVGNNGLNYKYKATAEEPFNLYVNDFDENNKKDIVLGYYNDGEEYPLRGRECSSQQIPTIKRKFKNYETFSEASLIDVYSSKSIKESEHYQVNTFASVYIENDNGEFKINELPIEAQVSSINSFLIDDFDGDNKKEVLAAGNLFASEVETPRNDAGCGVFLEFDNSNFVSVPSYKSGLFINKDVKNLAKIRIGKHPYIIVANNNDYLQFLKITE